METLIILLALITVAVPALTEAAVAATHVFAGGEWAREGVVKAGILNSRTI
jgi:hypothetical protein